MPFILSNMPSAWRFRLPSMPSAGNLLGTTRTVQPPELLEAPFGRYARTSEGVLLSLPGQNGQKPPFIFTGSRLKSVGRLARSVEIMTHRPMIGSLRNSGTANLGRTIFGYLTPPAFSRKFTAAPRAALPKPSPIALIKESRLSGGRAGQFSPATSRMASPVPIGSDWVPL